MVHQDSILISTDGNGDMKDITDPVNQVSPVGWVRQQYLC